MNNTLITSTAVAALLFASAITQADSNMSSKPGGSDNPSRSEMQRGSSDRDMGRMSGDDNSNMQHMQLTGDVDRDFAVRMKLHHQQGLAMAQTQLKESKSPEMRTMARKMIAAHKKEIAQFDKWLDTQR